MSTRFLITIAIMLVTVMDVLDMTIVNVSLPCMTGALDANSDQITWIITSYIVSAAIFMPLTGVLVKNIGRKKLLLTNIFGFLIASLLCGIATNLPEIILFRSLQGVFGASLVPLSQYILREIYPADQQGKAMAIWGMGIMVAPILGPTLGGYITENFNWRWVFYINIPISLFAFFLCWKLIEETPIQKTPLDRYGLISMVLGIGSLQVILDRGATDDWFSSKLICALSAIAILNLSYFIYHGLTNSKAIINLRIFLDRNFGLSSLLMFFYSAQTIGLISIQPFMLEHVYGFTTGTTGMIMAPRGITSAISMAIVAKMINKTDPRALLFIGLIIASIGTFFMSTYSMNTDMNYIMLTSCIQGFGMGLFFVPLSTLAFTTLRKDQIAEASGLFSFNRSIGVSVGISILITILTHERQLLWHRLGSRINLTNPVFNFWLAHSPYTATDKSLYLHIIQMISRQSMMIGFLDLYWASTVALFLMLPLVMLIKSPFKAPTPFI